MADKISTIITLIILVSAAFYAFENFYKPQLEGTLQENQTQLQQPTQPFSTPISFSSAWKIPRTNVTFRHNVSIENGTQLDVLSFDNAGNKTNVTLIIIVPKRLANHSSQVQFTQNFSVLSDDPIFYRYIEIAPGVFQVGIFVVSQYASQSPPVIIAAPIVYAYDPQQLEQLRQLIEFYRSVFDEVAPDQAPVVENELRRNLQPAIGEDGRVDFQHTVDNTRNYLRNLANPAPATSITAGSGFPQFISVDVHEYSLKGQSEFDVTSGTIEDSPLYGLNDEIANYARLSDLYQDGRKKIKIELDLSTLHDATQLPLGDIRLYYPERSAEVRIPVQAQIKPPKMLSQSELDSLDQQILDAAQLGRDKCVPLAMIEPIVDHCTLKHGVNRFFMLSIIAKESGCDPGTVTKAKPLARSPTGAIGFTQLTTIAMTEYNQRSGGADAVTVNRRNADTPSINICVGTKLFKIWHDVYRRTSTESSIQAYSGLGTASRGYTAIVQRNYRILTKDKYEWPSEVTQQPSELRKTGTTASNA